MLPHPLTNFEIQKYYQNEPKFKSAFSRNYSPKKEGWCRHDKSWWVQSNRKTVCDRDSCVVIMEHDLMALELNIFYKKLKPS